MDTLIRKYIKKAKHAVFTVIKLTFKVRMLWKLKNSEKSGDVYTDPLTHLYSYPFLASSSCSSNVSEVLHPLCTSAQGIDA